LEVRLTAEGLKSSYKVDNDWAAPDEVLDMPPEMRLHNKYFCTTISAFGEFRTNIDRNVRYLE
jgi:hypothetical protein